MSLQVKRLGHRGGEDVQTATRLVLTELFSPDLAKEFNWEGRHGKKALKRSAVAESIFRKYIRWWPQKYLEVAETNFTTTIAIQQPR